MLYNLFGLDSSVYYIAIPLQILVIIHALKTDRKQWLYMLIFIPVIGSLIYLYMEVLPDLRNGTFLSSLQRYFMPGQKIKQWERKVQISGSITNKLGLAEAYAEQKQYEKAIELTSSCLKGLYVDDPAILLQLARQYFQNGQYQESIRFFDQLNKNNGNFSMVEDELLHVRALEGIGEIEAVHQGYKRIIRNHHSLEAMFHYGMFLKKQQQKAEAKLQFQAVREEIKLLPRYLRRRNAQWSRRALKELM